jgi:hypothetical protein
MVLISYSSCYFFNDSWSIHCMMAYFLDLAAVCLIIFVYSLFCFTHDMQNYYHTVKLNMIHFCPHIILLSGKYMLEEQFFLLYIHVA